MPKVHRQGAPPDSKPIDGFSKMPHRLTADSRLSDPAYRAFAALESWAWNKPDCFPSNGQVATRCGWLLETGKPSIGKAKRALRELEALGYIRRVVVRVGDETKRERIEVIRDPGSPVTHPGSDLAHPRVKDDPPPGSLATHPRSKSDPPPGSNLTHTEEEGVRPREKTHVYEDPPRSAHTPEGGGEGEEERVRQQVMAILADVRAVGPTIAEPQVAGFSGRLLAAVGCEPDHAHHAHFQVFGRLCRAVAKGYPLDDVAKNIAQARAAGPVRARGSTRSDFYWWFRPEKSYGWQKFRASNAGR